MKGVVPGFIAGVFTWVFLVPWMLWIRKFLASKRDGEPEFEAQIRKFTFVFASVVALVVFLIFFGLGHAPS